jgi:hypothetical protein
MLVVPTTGKPAAATTRAEATSQAFGSTKGVRNRSRARQTSYQQRRKETLLALLDQYTDEVDRAAEEIDVFFDHLRQVGVRGLVAEHLNDADYQNPPSPKPKRHAGS